MEFETRNLIGDAWVGAKNGRELDVTDPATDALLARVPDFAGDETREAVDAAAAALPEWRARTADARARPLLRLATLMREKRDTLAELITRECGKPIAESRGEVVYAASFLDWSAEEARRVHGELVPAPAADKRILVLKQPVGVTAAITPWNFPAAMITRKVGPALAVGCTSIVKPAEQTPLTALALAALGREAGIPAGALNVITGEPGAIGDALLDDARVRKLSFTGSTDVGKLLMRKASQHVTRLSLELGGHAPFIVFDDADLDAAVQGAIASKFRNTGQTCICPNRYLIQSGVYDAFVGKFEEAVLGLRVGPGIEETSDVGPLIDDAAVIKVREHVEDARTHGARLRCGGDAIRPREGLTERFFKPTILEGISDAMKLHHEETFGPVAPLRRFRYEDEALEIANASEYGLAAYFYTRDAARLMRVAEHLDYGIIGANDGMPSAAQAPFGGLKQSGFGREGGKWALEEYLDVKYVSWGNVTR